MLHAQHAGPQDPALDPRGRTRSRSGSGADRRLSHVTPPAEEGRDAVRPPQAYPEARPPAPAGPEWCQGRVPPRRHRPKPPQARQADPDPAAGARLRGTALARPNVATRLKQPTSSTQSTQSRHDVIWPKADRLLSGYSPAERTPS